jgi:hypothetical protein
MGNLGLFWIYFYRFNGKRTVHWTHPNDAHIIAYNRTAATVFMHYRLSLVSSILYLMLRHCDLRDGAAPVSRHVRDRGWRGTGPRDRLVASVVPRCLGSTGALGSLFWCGCEELSPTDGDTGGGSQQQKRSLALTG